MKVGVCDTVIRFIDGNSGRIKVLEQLGVKPAISNVQALEDIDKLRIAEVELAEQKRQYKQDRGGCFWGSKLKLVPRNSMVQGVFNAGN